MSMGDTGGLDEDVDLDVEKRRYIADAHARLAQLTHYELVGVPRTADKKEIKRAYFQLATVLHPDRYFGKKLGSYKPKMEALFARLSLAVETLTDRDKRAAYDARLGDAAAGGAARPAAPKAPVDPRVLAQRQAAMDALKQRFTDGKAKAKQLVGAAELARAAGDFVGAAEAYQHALSASPGDPTIVAALADMKQRAGAKLADSHRRQAILEEKYGHWAEAAASWRKAVDARPDDTEARERLAAAEARTRGT
jgi:curved DNA-binding protein CbpA